MDVAAWLRSLGLDQYERAFRNNAVDAEVLPKLTAEDLGDLGVPVVGHRRKLLDAAALRDGAPPARGRRAAAEAEPHLLGALYVRTGRAADARTHFAAAFDLNRSLQMDSWALRAQAEASETGFGSTSVPVEGAG